MEKYKIVNGTAYNINTNDDVIKILEQAMLNKTRIILDYGDVKTGVSWGECSGVTGYVGRSTGSIKIPLLVFNSRSLGGGAILDHCIIGICTSKGKRVLYKHNVK